MGKPSDSSKLTIRVPTDVKEWLAEQTTRNVSSHASEIVRAVRERMERTTPSAIGNPAGGAT